jgi:hypothetical protein
VSTVTSTAISPLFGVCLLGIYQYVHTPEDKRDTLPFYSKPSFWITIGVLLLLVLLKDTIGAAAPLLKKPLDAVGVLVLHKASLILIAFPVMLHQIAGLTAVQSALSNTLDPVVYAADFGTAASAGHFAAVGLSLIAGAIITIIMWTIGHGVDVLCLLSPFPLLDVLLKGLRNTVVLGLVVATVLSPRTGLAASLVLIVLGTLLFSKALRLSIMGSYFAWDLLLLIAFRRRATGDKAGGVVGFSTGHVAGLPKHTLGRLTCGENGNLEFRYRILGFGPRRRHPMDKVEGYRIGRGLLYPSVFVPGPGTTRRQVKFRLPPRYKGAEEGVCAALGAVGVEDLPLQKGWRKFLIWAEGGVDASRRGSHAIGDTAAGSRAE